MTTLRRPRSLHLILSVNAVLLSLILACVWGRRPDVARAEAPILPPMSTAGGVSIMPGQLSPQTWGCYLYDAERNTLCVYSFKPGEHELRLEAARATGYDRQLPQYNTSPLPAQVQKWVNQPGAIPGR